MDVDSIFDKCSFCIDDRVLFGCFPTQENVDVLEMIGVRVFVNLTSSFEKKIGTYSTKYTNMVYPIADKSVPTDMSDFFAFISTLCDAVSRLGKGEKIYIHCKGGHGRSGLVVSCLLVLYYKITAENALNHTYHCHQQRKKMRDIWRKIGSPQTFLQKNFVHLFEKFTTSI